MEYIKKNWKIILIAILVIFSLNKCTVACNRDTTINKNDRICQFEIQKIQPEIEFEEVEHLDEVSRGGIGSTGKA